jgi:peroxiredoxin
VEGKLLETIFLVSSLLLWLVVLFNLLLTLALIRRVNARPSTTAPHRLVSLAIGTSAPPFEAQTLEGTPVTLDTYRGRPTFFAFVAPECSACHEVLPLLHSVTSSPAQTHTNVVIVSRADREQTLHMIEEFKLSLPVIAAPAETSAFFRDYQIAGTPSYCFINEKAIVKETGPLSPTNLEWKTLVA